MPFWDELCCVDFGCIDGTWFPHSHGTPLGVVFLCAWSLNDMCKVSLTVPRVVCLGEAVGWVGGRGRFGGGGGVPHGRRRGGSSADLSKASVQRVRHTAFARHVFDAFLPHDEPSVPSNAVPRKVFSLFQPSPSGTLFLSRYFQIVMSEFAGGSFSPIRLLSRPGRSPVPSPTPRAANGPPTGRWRARGGGTGPGHRTRR